jgi:hypothetical protein
MKHELGRGSHTMPLYCRQRPSLGARRRRVKGVQSTEAGVQAWSRRRWMHLLCRVPLASAHSLYPAPRPMSPLMTSTLAALEVSGATPAAAHTRSASSLGISCTAAMPSSTQQLATSCHCHCVMNHHSSSLSMKQVGLSGCVGQTMRDVSRCQC